MRTKYFFLIVLSLLLASCTIDIDTSIQLRTDEATVFYATIEDSGDAQTKVYADEDLRVLWNAGDRITIFNKTLGNLKFRFSGKDGDNAGSFIYESGYQSWMELEHIYAVYPYSETTSSDNAGVLTVSLPASQTYKPNSFGPGANTMVSVTDDNFLRFRNVGSYLCLKLYGDNVSIKGISIRGNNNEPLAGPATVTMPLGGTPTLEMQATAGKNIFLTCETPVKIGSSSDDPTSFWFVIPPTTFTKGITVTVMDDQDGIFEINSPLELTFERNKLVKLSPKEVIPNYDYVPIPDLSFRAYCVKNFDKDKDGKISFEEAADVTKITICADTLASLKGIEYFTNLTHLNCRGTNEWNMSLQIDVPLGALKEIDISKNTSLTALYCDNNSLTSLDVSKNTALSTLSCAYNQLTGLDVSKNTLLSRFSCANNKLGSLDVSNNAALSILYCNDNRLTNLVFGNISSITELYCYNNQLPGIDISKNTSMGTLYCNGNHLTSLNVENNTALTRLFCSSNQLSDLNVSNCSALIALSCESNQLTSLDVSNNSTLEALYCGENQLTSLNVENNTALTELQCAYNQLSNLDVSKNTSLTYLYCASCALSELDVSKNTALVTLQCGINPLTSVLLPATLHSISFSAFFNCSELTSIIIPPTVTEIGFGAFASCFNLSEIDIPDSVTRIDAQAFYDCKKLTAIRLHRETPPTGGIEMFYNTNDCPIYVPAGSVDAYKAAPYWSDYASRISAPETYDAPVAVDLGLSVKWAMCNVGANSPEAAGSYFAWGETATKQTYDWTTYKWCNGTRNTLTKYNYNSEFGTVDDKTVLDLSDDAVYANLGDGWRMPTHEEWTELRTQCDWEWLTRFGVYGYKVTAQNGNSIFLPAVGMRNGDSLFGADISGLYWSSSLRTTSPVAAYMVSLTSNEVDWLGTARCIGLSVRPVSE